MTSPPNLRKELYRVGGVSALAFVAGYVVIIGLYVLAGVPPNDGEAWLAYGSGKATFW